jgi:hypothetical protein
VRERDGGRREGGREGGKEGRGGGGGKECIPVDGDREKKTRETGARAIQLGQKRHGTHEREGRMEREGWGEM